MVTCICDLLFKFGETVDLNVFFLTFQCKLMTVNLRYFFQIGDTVGARLISHAGSLTNLAKYPASTVQILGAEKALFRALKTKGTYPLIYRKFSFFFLCIKIKSLIGPNFRHSL